jgi:hypothetical protein
MDDDTSTVVCPAHSGIAEAIKRLDGWQKTQNGDIQAMRQELSTIKNLVIGALLSGVLSLLVLVAKG